MKRNAYSDGKNSAGGAVNRTGSKTVKSSCHECNSASGTPTGGKNTGKVAS